MEVFADAEAFGVHFVTGALIAGDHDYVRFGAGGLAGFDLFQNFGVGQSPLQHIILGHDESSAYIKLIK